MKNFDLNSMGVQEMNTMEMQETDGGILVLEAVAALILLGTTSCHFEIKCNVGRNNTIRSNDSVQNGWEADSTRVDLNIAPSLPTE